MADARVETRGGVRLVCAATAEFSLFAVAARLADAAVRRDVPGAGPGGRSSFPALERRIVPLDSATAGRLRLERYRTLSPAGGIPPAGGIAVQGNTRETDTGDRKRTMRTLS